ncbi:MAG: hypothetical protein J6A07_03275 [Firmicutes bacterium]|nr:hypothetical protein [Bacillota bacterium]
MKKKIIDDRTVVFLVMSVITIVYIVIYLQIQQMSELAVSLSQFANRAEWNELADSAIVSEIIANDQNCYIQVFGVEPEAAESAKKGCIVRFYLENRSANDLTYSMQLDGLNAIACTDGIAPVVEAKHSKIVEMFIDKKYLELCGTNTEKFSDLEFVFKIYDHNDPFYAELNKTSETKNNEIVQIPAELMEDKPADVFEGSVHIYPYGRENAVKYIDIRGVQKNDEVLLDNENVTVTAVDYAVEKSGAVLGLLVTNKTDKDIELVYDKVYINETEIDGELAVIKAHAGKTSYEIFSVPAEQLKANDIDKIRKIEFAEAEPVKTEGEAVDAADGNEDGEVSEIVSENVSEIASENASENASESASESVSENSSEETTETAVYDNIVYAPKKGMVK